MVNDVTKSLNRKCVGLVALKGFFRITDEWELKPSQQKILLGNIPSSSFAQYKALSEVNLTNDVFERISYIFGIYKYLEFYFPL